MAFLHYNDIWQIEGLEASEKLILLALAHHADKDGICWPSQEILAKETGLGLRSVVRMIPRLIKKGVLEKKKTQKGVVYKLMTNLETVSHKPNTTVNEALTNGETDSHKPNLQSPQATVACPLHYIEHTNEQTIFSYAKPEGKMNYTGEKVTAENALDLMKKKKGALPKGSQVSSLESFWADTMHLVYDVPFVKSWTMKDKGMVNMFLNEATKQGIAVAPTDMFRLAVNKWPDFMSYLSDNAGFQGPAVPTISVMTKYVVEVLNFNEYLKHKKKGVQLTAPTTKAPIIPGASSVVEAVFLVSKKASMSDILEIEEAGGMN